MIDGQSIGQRPSLRSRVRGSSLDGRPPARLTNTAEPIIERVPVASIKVDTYQGDLIPARVRRIVSKFDASIFQPITISIRADGEMYVMDGKHRLAGAKALGHEMILCIIYEGLSYTDEARFFAETQRSTNRRLLGARELFFARLEYEETQAVAIRSVLDRHGFHVSRQGTDSPRGINAVAALDQAYKILGVDGLDEVIQIISSAWPENHDAVHNHAIAGMAVFWRRYRGKVSIPDMVKSLERVAPRTLLANGLTLKNAMSMNAASAMGMAILQHYNKGRRARVLHAWANHPGRG